MAECATPPITACDWVPSFAHGQVRDLVRFTGEPPASRAEFQQKIAARGE